MPGMLVIIHFHHHMTMPLLAAAALAVAVKAAAKVTDDYLPDVSEDSSSWACLAPDLCSSAELYGSCCWTGASAQPLNARIASTDTIKGLITKFIVFSCGFIASLTTSDER
jgi:hypothetical protein